MSSGLTDEQRKRIEENKRKAMERLSRKRSLSTLPQPQSKRLPPRTEEIKPNKGMLPSQNPSPSLQASCKGLPGASKSIDGPKRTISAMCTLCSSTRFVVDVTYDKQLIELFKSIGSKSYDSTTKMWTFGLKDHNTLIKSIKHTLPYIKLSPIPAVILNTFISTIDRAPNDTLTINYSDKIGSKLYSTLMGFQKQGIEYCIRRGGRCLIADDMGLGKTLQAIGVALYYHEEWPLLIVCPSSLKISWAEALQLWVPSLSEDNINVVMTTKGKLKGHITIISYDLLSRMSHKVDPDVQPGVIIVDESHFIKCYKAARTKAVIPLIKKSKRALLLSGTPALSRPIELYTQITSLENKFFMSLQDYGKRYCNGFQGTFGWNFSGSSNMTELQLYMEHKLMIRRLKRDVLDQLPSKRRQTVLLSPNETRSKECQEWKQFEKDLNYLSSHKDKDKKHTTLLPLFQQTGLVKLPAIKNYLLDKLEGDCKLIVFAHHKIVINGICEFLTEKKFKYIKIDGSTPSELRQSYCDKFQFDKDYVVAVLSITAANTGLTLTAASCVIFAELFWNPGVLLQAEDRAHRIGQHNSVNIHYLVANNTADDHIWPMIHKKLEVLTEAGLAGEDITKVSDSAQFHYNDQAIPHQSTIDDWFGQQKHSMKDLDEDGCISQHETDDKEDDEWFASLNEEDLLSLQDV